MQQRVLDGPVVSDSFVERIDPLPATSVSSIVESIPLADRTIAFDRIGFETLQSFRQAICITDARVDLPGPTISFVNNAYTEIFCCESADVVGRTPRVGQGPLTNRKVLDRLRDHLSAGESVHAQAINYRFDGSAFRLRWSIDPLHIDGTLVGFVAFMRDVTVDERMRRRLSALDTLMHRGRVVSSLRRADRDRPVAEALVAALRPIVAEIGTAVVRVGNVVESTQIDARLLDGSTPIGTEIPIGSHGTVSVDVHPDAAELIDHLAVGELAEHANWLLELGEPA